MPIKYDDTSRVFKLDTPNNSYAFFVTAEGLLVHTYYGGRVPDTDLRYLSGFADFESSTVENPSYNDLRRVPLEYSPYGIDNYTEACLMVKDKNGNATCDVRYDGYKIYNGKQALCGLPASYVTDSGDATSLEVYCSDRKTGLKIVLQYSVFEKLDIITRSVKLENGGEDTLQVERVLSCGVNLPRGKYDMISLAGGWARERKTERYPVHHGQNIISSVEGKTSHSMNNFFAVCTPDTTETSGSVYGCCLVYSGSFTAGTAVNDSEFVRMFSGINPVGFEWKLEPNDKFYAPEVLLTYSSEGLGKMSRTYHDLMRSHLVRGKWRDEIRPILINNWEATMFNFNTEKLIDIAKQAAEVGIEMLVMDDGWFGKRDNDNSSLGDWYVYSKKLPEGLKYLADKVNEAGLKFGIWFEPEMISPDSDLYRDHPDWCLHVSGRERHLSRKQLVLDFSRKEVRDTIYERIKSILEGANIEYVKWDHNRSLSEVGNDIEGYGSQMSIMHKNVLGMYEVQERLINDFPNLLLENCSGGGGRFDAGMLYYSPQIWLSDNTDAYERLYIQYGSSLCYPCSAFGAHVSAVPNQQTGRITPLSTRGAVAISGTFGYELDITEMTDDEKQEIKKQISDYKRFAPLVYRGDYYRLTAPDDEYVAWEFVSKDKQEVLLEYVKKLNTTLGSADVVRLQGLDENAVYRSDSGNEYSGALLMNAGIPIKTEKHDFASEIIHFVKNGDAI